VNRKSKTYIAVPAEILGIIIPLLLGVAFLVLAERKVMAFVQRRKGPDVVLVILKRWSIPLLFLATIVLFFYTDQLGFVDYFLSIGYQVSLRLGFRTLSFFLIQMGCSSGLALATGFVVTGLLTAGGEPTINHMQPAGGSSTAESFPSLSSIEKLPSISNDRDEVEQPVPDLETQRKDMTEGLDSFLTSFNKIAVRGDYLMTICERLDLDTASEENLNRIKAAMEIVSSREGAERPTSARKAGTALLALLKNKPLPIGGIW